MAALENALWDCQQSPHTYGEHIGKLQAKLDADRAYLQQICQEHDDGVADFDDIALEIKIREQEGTSDEDHEDDCVSDSDDDIPANRRDKQSPNDFLAALLKSSGAHIEDDTRKKLKAAISKANTNPTTIPRASTKETIPPAHTKQGRVQRLPKSDGRQNIVEREATEKRRGFWKDQ